MHIEDMKISGFCHGATFLKKKKSHKIKVFSREIKMVRVVDKANYKCYW